MAKTTKIESVDTSKFSKHIFKTKRSTTSQENPILKMLKNKYLDLTVNLGKNWHPYVNGRYMIFMNHGPWVNAVANMTNNFDISETTIDYMKSIQNFNSLYTRLATDIDLPQASNEYMNVSTRNQSITNFTRTSLMPDFSISYIEDQKDLSIVQYHDAWFKMLELYRRGVVNYNQPNSKTNSYFYNIPYLNSVWVLIFDINMQIRGLIYLIGVKPVNHPLKEFLGNRSSSKMTVYNLQYKTTNMYYDFFKNTDDFLSKLNKKDQNQTKGNILIKKFNTDMLKLNNK